MSGFLDLDGDGENGESVAAKDVCGFTMPIGLGHEPQPEAVDVSEMAVTAGVVVTAAFGGRGII